MLLVNLFFILVGFVALFFGADWLVSGASRLAASFGISALVIGLTLVAFGTSTPELIVSLLAALRGSSDIALGNVVGSNIANIGLILGLTALVYPIIVRSRVLRRELPIMIGLSLLTYFFALNGAIDRLDGLVLFVLLIAFNSYIYWEARQAEESGDEAAVAEFEEYQELEHLTESPDDAVTNRPRELARTLVGIAVLMVGAQLLVENASTLARSVGISELVIGITLVAFGTSLPELATSLVAASRDEDDISVGNIIGSNIYNLLAVLGLTALAQPITVPASALRIEIPIMLLFAIMLWPLARNEILSRWQGGLLFLGYLLFAAWLFVG
mgnify:CR=1 FL=1